MNLASKTILITGANRGLGRAMVDEALKRGATRVYAGTRTPFAHPDPRVTPVILDVTNEAEIEATAKAVGSLDILVNNAAIAAFDDLSDRSVIERHLAVNVFGALSVTQTFAPALSRSGGAIVNVLSDAALAPFPLLAAYSMSKAAALSMTQSLRALLAPRGVSVHAVLPGPIDTDMSRGADIPKSSPDLVARGLFDGFERGEEEIFPDPPAQTWADGWRSGVSKALERQSAAIAAQSLAVGANDAGRTSGAQDRYIA